MPVTSQALKAWNDPEEATEQGAAGIAVLLAERETGYEVIRRSRKNTGFDYWLGEKTSHDFREEAKLEVSGIRKGNNTDVRARVREKLRQMRRSRDLALPAYAIVVEFSKPLAEVGTE